jgi:hypothetical protein
LETSLNYEIARFKNHEEAKSMSTYSRWILINIFLPLSPFGLRLFIIFIETKTQISFSQIAQIPELLFFSVFLCVVSLNINLNGTKKKFESFLRLFILVILVLDFITLAMIYSNNFGSNIFLFSVVSSIIPAIIAPIYKFIYLSNQDEIGT